MPSDQFFMGLALRLASTNLGMTAPNPSVGCIIVKDGNIVAEGVTAYGGRPHAEQIALGIAGEDARNSTMYVTLEPCSHYGVTPPCAELILTAGIERVVIAIKDEDKRVNGQGIKMLQDAGLEVVCGVCEQEAYEANIGFFKVKKQGLPFTTLKLATSIDGKIALANGTSKWITGEKAREYAHMLRATHDAIMVGIGTIIADNPKLTCRISGMEERSPIRIIMDSHLQTPHDAALFEDAVPIWIMTRSDSYLNLPDKKAMLEAKGARIFPIVDSDASGHVSIESALTACAKAGITRLLVEGGSNIATSLLSNMLVDQLILAMSGKIIGNDGIPAIGDLGINEMSQLKIFYLEDFFKLGDDLVKIFKPYNQMNNL